MRQVLYSTSHIQGSAMATKSANPNPASDSGEELVLTPGGWRPKSKVHFVEPGQHVSGEGGKLAIVQSATGKTVKDLGALGQAPKEKTEGTGRAMKLAEVPKGRARPRPAKAATSTPRPSAVAAPLPTDPGPHGPAPITDGWIVFSGWTNASANPISYFKTQWTVPPAPASNNDQTVFLFNGIESFNADIFILQPVLQWGPSHAGGGSFWSIRNWFMSRNSSR